MQAKGLITVAMLEGFKQCQGFLGHFGVARIHEVVTRKTIMFFQHFLLAFKEVVVQPNERFSEVNSLGFEDAEIGGFDNFAGIFDKLSWEFGIEEGFFCVIVALSAMSSEPVGGVWIIINNIVEKICHVFNWRGCSSQHSVNIEIYVHLFSYLPKYTISCGPRKRDHCRAFWKQQQKNSRAILIWVGTRPEWMNPFCPVPIPN